MLTGQGAYIIFTQQSNDAVCFSRQSKKIVVFEKFQVHKKTIIYGSYDAEGVEGEHSILHIFMISIVCYNQMQRLLLAAWSNPFFSPADEYDPLA